MQEYQLHIEVMPKVLLCWQDPVRCCATQRRLVSAYLVWQQGLLPATNGELRAKTSQRFNDTLQKSRLPGPTMRPWLPASVQPAPFATARLARHRPSCSAARLATGVPATERLGLPKLPERLEQAELLQSS